MLKNIKPILWFLSGVVSGSGVTVLVMREHFRKKYEERADAEIEEMEKFYAKKVDEIIQYFPDNEEDLKFVVKVDEDEETERKEPRTVNYTKMYANKHPERAELTEEDLEELAAECESPSEDDVEDESMEAAAKRATEDHRANMHRPPKIISEEALGELPGYIENQTLFYYSLDDTLTDEDDQIIDDPDYLLGDTLDKYNFRESDEKMIFVRNFALDTVYEVQKVDGAFEEDE